MGNVTNAQLMQGLNTLAQGMAQTNALLTTIATALGGGVAQPAGAAPVAQQAAPKTATRKSWKVTVPAGSHRPAGVYTVFNKPGNRKAETADGSAAFNVPNAAKTLAVGASTSAAYTWQRLS